MPQKVKSPSPAPWSTSFVVKGGSKMRDKVLSFMPTPRVGDGQQNIGNGFDGATPSDMRFIEECVAGFDDQLSTFGHRILGIDGKIHQDLLDLTKLDAHRREDQKGWRLIECPRADRVCKDGCDSG